MLPFWNSQYPLVFTFHSRICYKQLHFWEKLILINKWHSLVLGIFSEFRRSTIELHLHQGFDLFFSLKIGRVISKRKWYWAASAVVGLQQMFRALALGGSEYNLFRFYETNYIMLNTRLVQLNQIWLWSGFTKLI